MTRLNDGAAVPAGYYLNTSTWEVTLMEPASTSSQSTFIHLSLPALLVLVPLMGLAFAMFLPGIGLALPVWACWRRATRSMAGTETAPR